MQQKICPSCSHEYVFHKFQSYFCTQCGSELHKHDQHDKRSRLCLLDGEPNDALFFLNRSRRNSIGREGANVIVLSGEQVSKRHAAISYKGGGYWIEDRHSKNGVYVNGKKIEQGQLQHGNVIKLGTAVLRFDDNKDADYLLLENYPNPFNLETEIRFQQPKAGNVTLKIYDNHVEEIRTLIDAFYQAGQHHVRWDGKDSNGKDVSSGIYLYQIQAGTFSQVKKMNLLR